MKDGFKQSAVLGHVAKPDQLAPFTAARRFLVSYKGLHCPPHGVIGFALLNEIGNILLRHLASNACILFSVSASRPSLASARRRRTTRELTEGNVLSNSVIAAVAVEILLGMSFMSLPS